MTRSKPQKEQSLQELSEVAEQQLKRVEQGYMPTEEGKNLIGQINKLKFMIYEKDN